VTGLPGEPSRFPDPRTAPPDAPLAIGGDLEPPLLLDAYRHGIFPWPDGRGCLSWWSPDPRAVFRPGTVHVSRTLRRALRSGRFRCTVDTAFGAVVAGCADRAEGTWITPEVAAAYIRLHHLGVAHSIEVWEGRDLVGGLYGVAIGGAFMGESMFHRVADASKVALAHLDERLVAAGFALFDAQLPTDHLVRMGVQVVRRDAFLDRLVGAQRLRTRPLAVSGPPD
jgi:leucyl/phenylalanyl-tRNA---protein transferase